MVQTLSLSIDLADEANRGLVKFKWIESSTASRTTQFQVTFPKPFATVPLVFLSLTGLDSSDFTSNSYGLPMTKLQVYPDEVTTTGFQIILEVWKGSTVAWLKVSWLAIDN